MNIALCCIVKNENRYIREFVEHYANLGFSHMFIYDNNDVNGEWLEEVICDYICINFVSVINYRGKELCQLDAYNDCYHNQCKNWEIDWCAFFDTDEFLVLNKDNSIQNYLSRDMFSNAESIQINWKIFDDNNLIYYEDKPLMERFTHFTNHNCREFKSIIKTGFDDLFFDNPHRCLRKNTNLKYISSNGILLNPLYVKTCQYKNYYSENYDYAQLNHYTQKTVEEYCNKILRGYPYSTFTYTLTYPDAIISLYNKQSFFNLNKWTQEKQDYIDKFFLEKIENNTNIYICTHKDFDCPIKWYSKSYKIVGQNITNTHGLNYIQEMECGEYINDTEIINTNIFLDFKYSLDEGTSMYYVWKTQQPSKYIGFCHNDKYFSFENVIPDLDRIFRNKGVICPVQKHAKTIYEQYKHDHNINDLDELLNIIKESYPDFNKDINTYIMNNNIYVPYNMFIMKYEDFYNYCSFAFNVLKQYCRKHNFQCDEDIKKYDQTQLLKYLLEILTTLWILSVIGIEKCQISNLRIYR